MRHKKEIDRLKENTHGSDVERGGGASERKEGKKRAKGIRNGEATA